MIKYAAVAFTSIAALALAACGGRSATAVDGGSAFTPQAPFAITFTLPKDTIGEELPSEGVGSRKDPTWGKIGGFTQTTKAQVLAFPPNTTVTIRNLSKINQHTLNVVGKAAKPPAHFPANPPLGFSAKGGGKLGIGYASGTINPGATVKVKLSKPGTYLIGCAFHYFQGMRDVIL